MSEISPPFAEGGAFLSAHRRGRPGEMCMTDGQPPEGGKT